MQKKPQLSKLQCKAISGVSFMFSSLISGILTKYVYNIQSLYGSVMVFGTGLGITICATVDYIDKLIENKRNSRKES